jgi:uncharacterized protein YuzE
MTYKIRYDDEADILLVILEEQGALAHAEEAGDIVVHLDKKGKALFVEILRASKIVPLMVEGLAKEKSRLPSRLYGFLALGISDYCSEPASRKQ